jgi:hypothetical protein
MSKTTLLVSTAVGLTLAVAPAYAAKHNPQGKTSHPSLNTLQKNGFKGWSTTKHGTVTPDGKKTVLTWSVSTMAGSFFAFDPTSSATIACKKGCTIVTESVANMLTSNGASTYEQTALCPVVDGTFTNGSCYYSGNSEFHDLYHTITNDTNITVGSGSHSIYVYLYSEGPAYWGHRQNQYSQIK